MAVGEEVETEEIGGAMEDKNEERWRDGAMEIQARNSSPCGGQVELSARDLTDCHFVQAGMATAVPPPIPPTPPTTTSPSLCGVLMLDCFRQVTYVWPPLMLRCRTSVELLYNGAVHGPVCLCFVFCVRVRVCACVCM